MDQLAIKQICSIPSITGKLAKTSANSNHLDPPQDLLQTFRRARDLQNQRPLETEVIGTNQPFALRCHYKIRTGLDDKVRMLPIASQASSPIIKTGFSA